jgi:putative MATE family efflux protein
MSALNRVQDYQLFSITWPIFVELGLQMLIRTSDVFMLSKVSDDAVASVGVSNQIIMMTVMLFQCVAMGTGVVMSHFIGAQQTSEIGRLTGSVIGINFVFGSCVSLFIVLFSGRLLNVFSLEQHLVEMAESYLYITGGALVVQALYIVTVAIIQSHGLTRHTMLVTLGINVLKITGNYMFIFGPFGIPKLGVTGVAIATVISQTIGLIINFLILSKILAIKLHWDNILLWKRDHVTKILKIGIPSAGVTLSYQGSQFVITMFISSLGTTILTTKIYTQNIMMMVMVLGISIARGTQIIVGHLVGGHEQEKAYTQVLHSLLKSIGITLIGVCLLSLFRVPILEMFTDSSEIIKIGSALLLLGFLLEPGRNFNVILEKSLQASGDATFAMISAVLVTWLFSLPLTYILGIHFGYGLYGIWVAFIIDEWVRGIVLYFRWRSRSWKEKSLVNIQLKQSAST